MRLIELFVNVNVLLLRFDKEHFKMPSYFFDYFVYMYFIFVYISPYIFILSSHIDLF